MEETIKQLYIKMDQDKDQDIIQFLLGKPKTFIVKEALRQYIQSQGTPQAAATPEPIRQAPKPAGDDPFTNMGNFGPKR